MHSRPADVSRLVALDWGTSRLRAFLLEGRDARVIARRDGPGVGMLRESPAEALQSAIAPWLSDGDALPVVMCGMAGSRNGVVEVPYAATPANAESWGRAAGDYSVAGIRVRVGAGLRTTNLVGAPDVMRGEETQIFGAMRLLPSLATDRRLFVLPGTHSKWVEVEHGAITRFHTVLTGELFALLRQHSTLLKAGPASGAAEDGFAAGVERSLSRTVGLEGALFEARGAQLLSGRSGAWAEEFLSGLLIGREVAEMSRAFAVTTHVTLVGDPGLCARYREVFAVHEIRTHELDGDECVVQGLHGLSRTQ